MSRRLVEQPPWATAERPRALRAAPRRRGSQVPGTCECAPLAHPPSHCSWINPFSKGPPTVYPSLKVRVTAPIPAPPLTATSVNVTGLPLCVPVPATVMFDSASLKLTAVTLFDWKLSPVLESLDCIDSGLPSSQPSSS